MTACTDVVAGTVTSTPPRPASAARSTPRGDELDQLLGLGSMQLDWVTGWARQRIGRGVWLVGERVFKVQTVLTAQEARLVDTNAALDNR